MSKELPYFKFEPNQWENGNIQMLSREDKGLFIDLCSMYWSRLGDMPLKLATQKLCAGNATALNSLCDEEIIEISEGNIFIKFLSEQLNEFEDTRKQNSKNAKEGWEKRRKQKEESDRNATASIPQSENDAIKEDKTIRNDTKVNKIKFDFKKNLLDLVQNEILVNDYILLRKNKKASLSQTFFESLKSQCENNNYPIEEALKVCIERNWIGFKYTWITNLDNQEKKQSNGTDKPTAFIGRQTAETIEHNLQGWDKPTYD